MQSLRVDMTILARAGLALHSSRARDTDALHPQNDNELAGPQR